MARTTEGSKVIKHTTFQIQWRECYLQGLKDTLFCSAISHDYIHAEDISSFTVHEIDGFI